MTPKKGNRTKQSRPHEWHAPFLKSLAASANVSAACRVAKVSRQTAYVHHKANEAFRAAWDDATETACDNLELEARRRAVDGVLRPIYQGGRKVGQVREYSDVLLIFLLKAHRPQKYRERISIETCPSLTPETVKLLTDVEIDDAIGGKITPAQIETILAVRRAQQGRDA